MSRTKSIMKAMLKQLIDKLVKHFGLKIRFARSKNRSELVYSFKVQLNQAVETLKVDTCRVKSS